MLKWAESFSSIQTPCIYTVNKILNFFVSQNSIYDFLLVTYIKVAL